MADGLQVFNSVLNLADFLSRQQAAKDAARVKAQNLQDYTNWQQDKLAQQGFDPGLGPDGLPLMAPVGEAAKPVPDPLRQLMSGNKLANDFTKIDLMPGLPTPGLAIGGPPPTGAPGKLNVTPPSLEIPEDDGTDVTPDPMRNPVETDEYLDPNDPATGAYGAGAISMGWPRVQGFPYVNPTKLEFTMDENGNPVKHELAQTKEDLERIGTQYMGYWLAHGGSFKEGLKRARAAGMMPTDQALDRMGREAFEEATAQMRENYRLKFPGAGEGELQQASIIAAANVMGGYVPQQYMGIYQQPSNSFSAATDTIARVMAEDFVKDKKRSIASAESQGRKEGEIQADAANLPTITNTEEKRAAAATRGREAETPIGFEVGRAYNVDPAMPQKEFRKLYANNPWMVAKSEKEREFFMTVNNARNQIKMFADMAAALAEPDWKTGLQRFIGSLKLMGESWMGTEKGDAVNTYNRLLNEFKNQVARGVMSETGVLTNADIERSEFFKGIGVGIMDSQSKVRAVEQGLYDTLDSRLYAFWTTRGIQNPGRLVMDSEIATRNYSMYIANRRAERAGQPLPYPQLETAPELRTADGTVPRPPEPSKSVQGSTELTAFDDEDYFSIISMLPPEWKDIAEKTPEVLPPEVFNKAALNFYATQGRGPSRAGVGEPAPEAAPPPPTAEGDYMNNVVIPGEAQ